MKPHETPLRAAIVGSGPSGFFCADYLLRLAKPCTVAMFERCPYPFGLVRDAVAPDKPNIRASMVAFTKTAQSNGFSFFGNVAVGRDISIEEIAHHYHAVIIATGASVPRPLPVQGGALPGCVDAVNFAGWYNGREDCAGIDVALDSPSVVIIGAGNAALDAARILAAPASVFAHTDMAGGALETLKTSGVTDIHVVARRGPYDVRFAPQELELLAGATGCAIEIHADAATLEPHPTASDPTRLAKAYRKAMHAVSGARRIHFHFDMTPVAMLGAKRVEGVLFETPEGESVHIPCGLAISSIGQRGSEIPGLPFDDVHGSIPNASGRIREGGHLLPGLYVAGAAKRGENSVIGANKPDCLETVKAVIEDGEHLACPAGQDDHAMLALLIERGIRVVTFPDWQRIDALERSRGRVLGKSRDRFLSLDETLAAVESVDESGGEAP